MDKRENTNGSGSEDPGRPHHCADPGCGVPAPAPHQFHCCRCHRNLHLFDLGGSTKPPGEVPLGGYHPGILNMCHECLYERTSTATTARSSYQQGYNPGSMTALEGGSNEAAGNLVRDEAEDGDNQERLIHGEVTQDSAMNMDDHAMREDLVSDANAAQAEQVARPEAEQGLHHNDDDEDDDGYDAEYDLYYGDGDGRAAWAAARRGVARDETRSRAENEPRTVSSINDIQDQFQGMSISDDESDRTGNNDGSTHEDHPTPGFYRGYPGYLCDTDSDGDDPKKPDSFVRSLSCYRPISGRDPPAQSANSAPQSHFPDDLPLNGDLLPPALTAGLYYHDKSKYKHMYDDRLPPPPRTPPRGLPSSRDFSYFPFGRPSPPRFAGEQYSHNTAPSDSTDRLYSILIRDDRAMWVVNRYGIDLYVLRPTDEAYGAAYHAEFGRWPSVTPRQQLIRILYELEMDSNEFYQAYSSSQPRLLSWQRRLPNGQAEIFDPDMNEDNNPDKDEDFDMD